MFKKFCFDLIFWAFNWQIFAKYLSSVKLDLELSTLDFNVEFLRIKFKIWIKKKAKNNLFIIFCFVNFFYHLIKFLNYLNFWFFNFLFYVLWCLIFRLLILNLCQNILRINHRNLLLILLHLFLLRQSVVVFGTNLILSEHIVPFMSEEFGQGIRILPLIFNFNNSVLVLGIYLKVLIH